MAKTGHLPSVVGCALGFGFSGCGAGVLPGGWTGSLLREPVLGTNPPPLSEAQLAYGSVYAGSFLGMLIGGVIGVQYARGVRRKHAATDTAPKT